MRRLWRAGLHRHAEGFAGPIPAGCRRKDADWLSGPASALRNGTAAALLAIGDYAAFRSAADQVVAAMARLRRSPGQFGLIHADLEPGNWVFHAGDPRPIDFDEFGLGIYGFDLMGPRSRATRCAPDSWRTSRRPPGP
jgi:Ser/Thr protein kinase RdoA (MazF antagonist)